MIAIIKTQIQISSACVPNWQLVDNVYFTRYVIEPHSQSSIYCRRVLEYLWSHPAPSNLSPPKTRLPFLDM
jgi:hypothetical protein